MDKSTNNIDDNLNANSTGLLTIPYVSHEADMARQERHGKRLWILVIILVGLLAITNLAWLWFFNQYEYIAEETVTVDGEDGIANYNHMEDGGDIINGEYKD